MEDTSLISNYMISRGIGPVVKNNMLHMKHRFTGTWVSYLWSWVYGFNNLFWKRVSEEEGPVAKGQRITHPERGAVLLMFLSHRRLVLTDVLSN